MEDQPNPTTEQSWRRAFVELCQSFHGLNASPTGRADYLALVGPDEGPAMRAAFTTALVNGRPGMSGCALVVRGAWKRAGIHHPRLDRRYVVGKAVEDVIQIANEAHAFTDLRAPGRLLAPLLPPLGAVLWMSGPEHVEIVTEVTTTGGGAEIEAIAGGQRDGAGWQTVRGRVRRWVAVPARGKAPASFQSRGVIAGDTVGVGTGASQAAPVRTLLGWVDSWKVWQAFGRR